MEDLNAGKKIGFSNILLFQFIKRQVLMIDESKISELNELFAFAFICGSMT